VAFFSWCWGWDLDSDARLTLLARRRTYCTSVADVWSLNKSHGTPVSRFDDGSLLMMKGCAVSLLDCLLQLNPAIEHKGL
jgi:hypothetical protein